MWGHRDRQFMVERSDRMWSTGEGKGYSLQYSDLENFMDCIIHGVVAAKRSYPTSKVRGSGRGEQPHV